MVARRIARLVRPDMTIKGPSQPIPYPYAVAECVDQLSEDFDEVHRAMVNDGRTERQAALELMVGSDHPQLQVLASEAIRAKWSQDIVRRALLVLASLNRDRALNRE